MDDTERVRHLLSVLQLDQGRMCRATIPGPPWSKSRPAFTRSGVAYTRPLDREAEKKTAAYLRQAVRQPFPGNVGLICIFYRPNRRVIDTDNLIKALCDSANGILWRDDSQATLVLGIMEYDKDNPRTLVAIGEHHSTLRRGTNAETRPRVARVGPANARIRV